MKTVTQRGAALLVAMLTVTMVATLASAALWQQWRNVEVEAAERTRMQSSWILTGALDWARLILREDARSPSRSDHLAEPWAVPLQEARLSTFLAADPTNNSAASTVGTDAENVFLSGQITDLQSLLNVTNLVENSNKSPSGMVMFGRLFDLLGLPRQQLDKLAENLRFAQDIKADNLSAGRAALPPQNVEQLVWLGLPAETVQALAPYITILPQRTPVNLNTASAEVIYAAGVYDPVDTGLGISLADAQRMVTERERQHFSTEQDALKLAANPGTRFASGTVAASSRYFEVRGRLRLNDLTMEQRSIVVREANEVRTLTRENGVVHAGAPVRPVAPR
jgi:general secretion pathway protein K